MKTFAYQIEPAGCGEIYPVQEVLETWEAEEGWIYEAKLDGIRYLLQIYPNQAKTNYLTSRRISVITQSFVEKQDKVTKVRDFPFPVQLKDTILDGEIVGGNLSSDTQHEMVTGNVDYYVWDVLMLCGRDLRGKPLEFRLEVLKGLKEWFPPWIKLVDNGKDPKSFLKKILDKGGEGMVAKNLKSPYGQGWIKIKKEQTFDVVIFGYEESEAENYAPKGWIKSVRFGQWVKTDKEDAKICLAKENPQPGMVSKIKGEWHEFIDCGRTSGMVEKVRDDISKHRKEYLGRVIEVEAQQQLKSGKFRHPRFKRFRDDKNGVDCVWSGEAS